MDRSAIFEKVNAVIRDVFDDDSIVVNDKTVAKDVEGWDSLMNITLIATLEDEFGIHFSMKDVTGMKNVGEMVDRIAEMTK